MTGRQFMNAMANGQIDLLALVLKVLEDTASDYCLVGGLAVNAYAEPVVSLDLDLVVIASKIEVLCEAAAQAGMRIERFPHSLNLTAPGSDLRVQIQTDPRYQEFLGRAQERMVLGYQMKVAALQDVLVGKLWAYSDPMRRRSKRHKDLADIARLVEAHPTLAALLPDDVRNQIE